ncbi:MAG TPA: hypothetical protein VE178_00580 [Silvibacterium sp.]|jgi:hypothetical protein|nr:hypothetical protein [Silvibacterium sp.]
MPSSRKKAIARRFTRDWVAGYVVFDGSSPEGFLKDDALEMLALDGKVLSVELKTIKWLCFVRDFNSGEPENPERLLRKSFAGRPRTEGLHLRAVLTDGDQIEGIASNDLSLLTAEGILLTPPDTRSNTQRLWIPAASVSELEVVAVIGGAKKKLSKAEDRQESLFG